MTTLLQFFVSLEGRNNAGVLFASIPNFTEFYSEDVNEGVECIRLLNEIIVDFDQILDDEKFRTIEKIKTIGSTYMAASGINPLESERDELAHLCDLVDFAIEMKNKLEDINVHSFNTFQLRIGKHQFSMVQCDPHVFNLGQKVQSQNLFS